VEASFGSPLGSFPNIEFFLLSCWASSSRTVRGLQDHGGKILLRHCLRHEDHRAPLTTVPFHASLLIPSSPPYPFRLSVSR